MDISQLLAFAVKEEILRNVLKSHQRVLVLGFSGTGKTSCTLRALANLGTPCYFSPLPYDADILRTYAPAVNLLSNIPKTPPENVTSPMLIVDGLHKIQPEQVPEVIHVLKEPGMWQKVVLTSQILIDSKDLMPNIEVVVKMKDKTAEMMYSKLLDVEK